MTEIRPKVLPKLREENENAKKKGGKKKKGIKDVVSQEDFEVVIFLKDLSTRHSLLTKQKRFADKPRLKSTGSKLTGWLNNSENAIRIDEDERPPAILQEEDDHVIELHEIPEAATGSKRQVSIVDNGLFVSSDEDDAFEVQPKRPSKLRKRGTDKETPPEESENARNDADDKKKLALNTAYEGFSIYGRTLCLVVKRKGKKAVAEPHAPMGGSQMMEQWVSTQAAQEAGLDEDDD